MDGFKRSVKLDGLSTGETYSIQLKSRSYDRESEFVSTANVSIPSLDAHRPVAAFGITETADLSLQGHYKFRSLCRGGPHAFVAVCRLLLTVQ